MQHVAGLAAVPNDLIVCIAYAPKMPALYKLVIAAVLPSDKSIGKAVPDTVLMILRSYHDRRVQGWSLGYLFLSGRYVRLSKVCRSCSN